MNNSMIIINGVRGRLDANGNPELNLEDVARGLGFTETKDTTQYVMWRRVERYLASFGTSAESGVRPDYIPENIFYKLCFKASNEVARKFQDTVTDEVLPAIRKHGAYITPEKIEEVLLNPDTIIQLAMQLKSERERRASLEYTIAEQQPKVLFADAVETSHTSILVGDLAKLLNQNGLDIGQNRLFNTLRRDGYLCSRGSQYNLPTQRAMDLRLFEVRERTVTNPDGSVRITRTTKVTGKGQIYFINKYCGK